MKKIFSGFFSVLTMLALFSPVCLAQEADSSSTVHTLEGNELSDFIEAADLPENTEIFEIDESCTEAEVLAALGAKPRLARFAMPAFSLYSNFDLNEYTPLYFRQQLTGYGAEAYDSAEQLTAGFENAPDGLTFKTPDREYALICSINYELLEGETKDSVKAGLASKMFSALRAWKYDHLAETLWTSALTSVSVSEDPDTGIITLNGYWSYSSYYTPELRIARDKALEEIQSAVDPEADRYHLLKYYHDMICQKTEYDEENASAGSDRTTEKYYTGHCSAGSLIYGMGVCESYAKAFKLLCDQGGIPCVPVISSSHMWNYVLMEDGLWYMIDCTWDDTLDTDDYFLVSNREGTGIHQEDYFSYPITSENAYSRPIMLPGDMDDSGNINLSDACMLADMLASQLLTDQNTDLPDESFPNSDTDGNGITDLYDLQLLVNYLVENE